MVCPFPPPSLCARSASSGGSGFSGIAANFYPQFLSWLCANVGHPKAPALQQFLSIAENVVMYKYPSSAKAFLAKFDGLAIKPANNRNGCAFPFPVSVALRVPPPSSPRKISAGR